MLKKKMAAALVAALVVSSVPMYGLTGYTEELIVEEKMTTEAMETVSDAECEEESEKVSEELLTLGEAEVQEETSVTGDEDLFSEDMTTADADMIFEGVQETESETSAELAAEDDEIADVKTADSIIQDDFIEMVEIIDLSEQPELLGTAAEDGTSMVTAYTAALGSRVDAVISAGGESVWYKFTPAKSGELFLYSRTSSSIFGRLYDAKGNLLEEDDYGGGFYFTKNVKANASYYLETGYSDAAESGTITIVFDDLSIVNLNTYRYVLPGNTAVLEAEVLTLRGDTELTYTWYKDDTDGELLASGSSSRYVTEVIDEGRCVYCCVVTDGIFEESIYFYVTPREAYLIYDYQVYIREGDEAPVLTVTPCCQTENVVYSYKWYEYDDSWSTYDMSGNWIEISGATGNSYTAPVREAVYGCVVTIEDENGEELYKLTATLGVSLVSDLTVRVTSEYAGVMSPDQTVPVTFSVAASTERTDANGETAKLTYQWYKYSSTEDKWTAIAGANNSYYTVSAFDVGWNWFRCEVSDGFSEKTKTFDVKVTTDLEVEDVGSYSRYAETGQNITLAVNATGKIKNFTYQWYIYDHDEETGTETKTPLDCTEASMTIQTPEKYTEYLCEVSDGYETGSGWFQVYPVENGLYTNAAEITLNEAAKVEIASEGESKVFKFVPTVSGLYEVNYDEEEVYASIQILDEQYAEVSENWYYGGHSLIAGKTYYIVVKGETGSFDIYLRLEHEHTLKVSSSTPATCSSYGKIRYSCSCYSAYTEWIAPNGEHNYKEEVTTTPTCVQNGIKTYTCTECAHKKTEIIPVSGQHIYAEKITKAATCIANGTKTFTCTGCGDEKTETIPMTGHSYEVTETAATIFSPAVKTSTCTVCKDTITETTGEKLPGILELPGNLTTLTIRKGKNTKIELTMAEGDSVVSCVAKNKKCVKVSLNKTTGKLTLNGKKNGSSKVTITLASGKTRTYTVKVTSKTIKTKAISGVESSLTFMKKGDSVTLNPVLKPFTSTQKITYSSSNKKVASVTKSGKVKAVSAGKATITVKSGSVKKTCKVTVVGIGNIKSSISLKVKKSVTLSPRLYGVTGDISYESSNTAVARVNSKGKITARKKGNAVITVKVGNYTAKCRVKVSGK